MDIFLSYFCYYEENFEVLQIIIVCYLLFFEKQNLFGVNIICKRVENILIEFFEKIQIYILICTT